MWLMVTYESVCKLVGEREREKNSFQIWPRKGDLKLVEVKAQGIFRLGKNRRGANSRVVQPTQTTGGHPHTARSTPRNVSRTINEINAFEWEGDFKPMVRQALKELLENRLDQPFTQLEPTLQKRHEGTGLGLHLSKRLAELLGGVLTAESEYGKGSTFTLTIPHN